MENKGDFSLLCFPVGELVEALQMDPMEFKERYNQKMPARSDRVVFSCLAGTRSKQALGFAMSLGFSRYGFCKDGINVAFPHEAECLPLPAQLLVGKGKTLNVE